MTNLQDPLKPLAEIFKPDERQAFMVGTLEELHAELTSLVLTENVPLDVRQQFETAKNARLYAYFAFRFHQVAEMVGYQALEMALRSRWNIEEQQLAGLGRPTREAPMLAGLLKHAAASGWIRNEGFSGARSRAENAVRAEIQAAAMEYLKAHPEIEEIELREPTTAEVDEKQMSVDVVGLVIKFLPEFRNTFAHGSPMLVPNGIGKFRDICDAINMVFDGTPPRAVAGQAPKPGLHGHFKQLSAGLEAKRVELFACQPVTRDSLPRTMPLRGVYVFTESERHLYVGRTNTLRKRIGCHCRPSADHGTAPFAFRLAKEKCGIGKATYRKGSGRADLAETESMKREFRAAKDRIRAMHVRFVEEVDPIRQMLLEVYVAVVHKTPYNDFDNH